MKRWERLATLLKPHEAALVLSEQNRRYLTGFSASDGAVLITPEAAWFFTDSRYIEAAEQRVTAMPSVQTRSLTADLLKKLRETNSEQVYTEREKLTLAEYERMRKKLSDISVTGSEALDDRLRMLREVKSAEELRAVREAQRLTDEGYLLALSRIAEGVSERELALDMEFFMRRAGAEGTAFDFIVASGENSSMPHAVPTDRLFCRGDFITMDFGARVDGYCSDMTRTVALGTVSDEQRMIYELVLQAQQAALTVIREGLQTADADAAARDVIIAAGFGPQFGHATGHGVGLDIHESPVLSGRGRETLRAGELVTVEPGVYLPGKFGVRIEDMVLVTANGCENLTKSEKKLTIL